MVGAVAVVVVVVVVVGLGAKQSSFFLHDWHLHQSAGAEGQGKFCSPACAPGQHCPVVHFEPFPPGHCTRAQTAQVSEAACTRLKSWAFAETDFRACERACNNTDSSGPDVDEQPPRPEAMHEPSST